MILWSITHLGERAGQDGWIRVDLDDVARERDAERCDGGVGWKGTQRFCGGTGSGAITLI
jgi:hypothetical protein